MFGSTFQILLMVGYDLHQPHVSRACAAVVWVFEVDDACDNGDKN